MNLICFIVVSEVNEYKRWYEELHSLGSGAFGEVFVAKNKFDGREYAVKKIKYQGNLMAFRYILYNHINLYYTVFVDHQILSHVLSNLELFIIIKINTLTGADQLRECMREMQNLIKVRSEYCVQYMSQWYENNVYYIEMELCSDSLQNILQHKPQVFGRQPGEPMNSIEFYISCHIFKEILECVQYLHELNPPVIHRDLKPDNILVAKTVRNCRFFKICDFGLAIVHQHSSDKGDLTYQAPEVGQGVVYNHKIDVYSLAIIAENDIFGIHLEDKP